VILVVQHKPAIPMTPFDWLMFWLVLAGCFLFVFGMAFGYIWICLWIAGR
jgi:hypothetical protein